MLHVSKLGYSLFSVSTLVQKGLQVSLKSAKASVSLNDAVVSEPT